MTFQLYNEHPQFLPLLYLSLYLLGPYRDSSPEVIMLCHLMTSANVYTYIAANIMPSIDSIRQGLCILT